MGKPTFTQAAWCNVNEFGVDVSADLAAMLADNDRLHALVQSCPIEFEPEEGEHGYDPFGVTK